MDKPFDSNYFRKTPRLMKLGEGKFTLGTGKEGIIWANHLERRFFVQVFLRSGFAESAMFSHIPPSDLGYLGDGLPRKVIFALT